MKYEVTVSVKKTYEIEANDIAQAVNEGLDIFRRDFDVPCSVSAITCDSVWKSTPQAVDDSFDPEDYYTPEQAAYQLDVSCQLMYCMIKEKGLPAINYNNNWYIPKKSYKDINWFKIKEKL